MKVQPRFRWDSFFYTGGSVDVAEEASLSIQGGLHGKLGGGVGKAGGGALVIEGSQPSTFTGYLQVGAGALVAAAVPGSAAVPRKVLVQDGAALVTAAPDQLRDATVGLSVDAVLDLLGHDQSLNYLGAEGVVLLGYAEDGAVDHATLRTNDAYLTEAVLAVVLGANESDHLEVAGTATLGGSLLDVTVTGEVPLGREHVVVRAGRVDGNFVNVAHGQYASFGNRSFRVSYRAGDGNDVSLTRADAATTPAPAPAPNPAPTPAPTPASRSGYWMVGTDGAVYGFGAARWLGNAQVGSTTAEDLEPTPSNFGYWVLDATGRVHAFGDAAVLGDLRGRLAASERATSISRTPSGRGYWLFTASGRAVPFGDAAFFGDMSGSRLNGPVLDSVPTPSGRGYYMVASDGGIFAFGDAAFAGSMGGSRLNAPVQSLVPDGDGRGYWLVASDGGIFAFSAPFYGSMGASRLNRPITGMVASGTGGYLMVGEDGGIFAFGSASFQGSLGDRPPAHPITAVAVVH